MIRYHDRKTITRSRKLDTYIDEKSELLFIARELFEQNWNEEPIRLLGVTVQHIEDKRNVGEQLDLFTYEEAVKKAQLKHTVEQLKDKFGDDTFKVLEKTGKHDENYFRTSFQKDFLDDFRN